MDNTRRDVLIGAMGVVTVAGVGSGILFLTHRDPPKTLQTGSLLYTYTGHPGYLSAVAWSSDGQRIASGGTDKTIQVWDATNGGNASTYNGHTDWVEEVVWSPDRRYIASASKDKTVRVWDTTSGGNTFVYRGHIGLVWDVAWSPDGKRIASSAGGTFDGTVLDATVQVWDAPNGGNVYTYRGHPFWSYVYTVVWSPNGQFIASGSNDGTVLVWNATNGDNVSTYKKQPYILGGVVA
ncbi:MAG: WD40 repeat domain-containing protein [Ktedonobacteraceae bacterium]|nr:WD40 repeat domain-containing protein [Ktedonobacteraceae bacterium]